VNSTDNILISKLIGLATAGLYGNYYTIIHPLQTVTNQIFESIVASVGNLSASAMEEDRSRLKETFNDVFFFAFWVYTFLAVCLLNLLPPFIEFIWLRNRGWLLDKGTLIVLVINFYLYGMRRPVLTFRDASGAFWNDRYKPLFEAAINLVASILLAKRFGLMGIFLGTMVSTITTSLWVEPYVLYRNVFDFPLRDYFIRFLSHAMVTTFVCYLSVWICSLVGYSLVSVIPRLFICIVLPNAVLFLMFFWTNEFKYFGRLAKELLTKVRSHGSE
jgi:O-antigen/teichoic acid export membrane protein